jgi:hypothetical protein
MTRKEEILLKFQQIDNDQINDLVDEGKEITNHEWRKKLGQYQRNGYLRFKPELVHELAKPFTTPTQMTQYEGENEVQIRSAGRLLEHRIHELPEWFELEKKHQTIEECIEEARSAGNIMFDELPPALIQKLHRHLGSREMRELLPNILWQREYRSDDDFVELLSKFKTASEMRNTSREMKNLLSRVIGDKGVKYPKAYKLAESMKTGKTGAPKGKRGSYAQRTPAIEQYDLNNNLVQVFKTWNDVIEAGFKRPTIVGALTRKDANSKAKGYLWKYEGKEWGEGLK